MSESVGLRYFWSLYRERDLIASRDRSGCESRFNPRQMIYPENLSGNRGRPDSPGAGLRLELDHGRVQLAGPLGEADVRVLNT